MTNSSLRDASPIADTASINWNAVNSEQSGKAAQGVEAGVVFEIRAESDLQAISVEDLCRKAGETRAEEKRQKVDQRHRLTNAQSRRSSVRWATKSKI